MFRIYAIASIDNSCWNEENDWRNNFFTKLWTGLGFKLTTQQLPSQGLVQRTPSVGIVHITRAPGIATSNVMVKLVENDLETS